MKSIDGSQQPVIGRGVVTGRLSQRYANHEISTIGQELVQRRIQQSDRDRQTVHLGEQLDEVSALQRHQGVECEPALICAIGQDHPLN
jgi:hypothetical protein